MKELRSYMGDVSQMTKFIPGVAQIKRPFRDILKKDEKWSWNENHDNAFEKVPESLKQIVKANKCCDRSYCSGNGVEE